MAGKYRTHEKEPEPIIRSEFISVPVTVEEKTKFKKFADSQDRSIAWVARRAMLELMKVEGWT